MTVAVLPLSCQGAGHAIVATTRSAVRLAIRQQSDWLLAEGLLRLGTLLISDRGTFSAEHVARLHRHGCPVLCSVPWEDYRGLYDRQADQLNWQRAS